MAPILSHNPSVHQWPLAYLRSVAHHSSCLVDFLAARNALAVRYIDGGMEPCMAVDFLQSNPFLERMLESSVAKRYVVENKIERPKKTLGDAITLVVDFHPALRRCRLQQILDSEFERFSFALRSLGGPCRVQVSWRNGSPALFASLRAMYRRPFQAWYRRQSIQWV